MSDLIEFIKAAPRPILSVMLPLSWVYTVLIVLSQGGTLEDIPWLFTSVCLAPVLEYWGERTIKRIREV